MGESYVRSSDVSRLLEIVESAEAADDTEIFYSSVLRALNDLIPCDNLSFQLMDIPRRSIQIFGFIDGEIETFDDDVERDPNPEDQERFWAAYWLEGGLLGRGLT